MVESTLDNLYPDSHSGLPSLELGRYSGRGVSEDIAAGDDIADDWREEEAG